MQHHIKEKSVRNKIRLEPVCRVLHIKTTGECLYPEGPFLCSSISATASQYNPPNGSSFQGPTPQGWQANPSAGTEGLLAPSQTDPSCVLQPKHEDRQR